MGRRIEREQAGNVILWRILMTDEKGTQHRRLGVAYEIDARGDLVKVFVTRAVDGIASVELVRDQTGRVVRETQRCGGWTFSVQREFDSLGYEVGTRYSTGWYVSRRRGKGGVIEQLTVHGEGGGIEEALAFEHGPEEVMRRLDRRTGVAITRDRLGRPVRVRAIGEGGASIRERAFEWAPQPGVATVVDSAHGRRSYYLDAIGRVRRASGLGVEEKYEYAAQGTPIAGSEGAASVGRGGRKRATGSARFLWDASGRLAQRLSDSPASSWTYVYDGESRLIEARRHEGFVVRFVYDAFGRRLALLRSDGTSTWFGWDGDSVVEERPSAGHAVRRVFREIGGPHGRALGSRDRPARRHAHGEPGQHAQHAARGLVERSYGADRARVARRLPGRAARGLIQRASGAFARTSTFSTRTRARPGSTTHRSRGRGARGGRQEMARGPAADRSAGASRSRSAGRSGPGPRRPARRGASPRRRDGGSPAGAPRPSSRRAARPRRPSTPGRGWSRR
ncbi:hypothetical protein [Sorangium sp. So ce1151]|uniref:hypothetical protein n=1 Tax=Sorangium sp. So ce1151 TaxID=3133332 RepID=UPI003F643AEF